MTKLKKDDLKNKILENWSYFQLQKMIEYKAENVGIKVRYINPEYTSQKCSVCGHVDKENRESQSKFICKKCGFTANADYNASQNIAKSN
ncbi:transposase [Clostridium fermenticellae]|uniref:transposase n=1 Tax=Clostridium fermenticellae TaxID=2068654 RepID=UPI00242BF8B5|nr:transposase [Clostridium fermenticellae]